ASLLGKVSVEAPFRMVGAPKTGQAIKIRASLEASYAQRGLDMASRMAKAGRLSDSRWYEMTFAAATRAYLDEMHLSKEERARAEKVLDMYERWRKDMLRRQQKVGAVKEEWPRSRINELREHIIPDLERSVNKARSQRTKELRQGELQAAKEELHFLTKMGVKYVHILAPWLEKYIEEEGGVARIAHHWYTKRKTYDIRSLVEFLVEEGYIEKKDADLRVIVVAYAAKVGRVIARYGVLRAALEEKLLVPVKVRPYWPAPIRKLAPGYSGSQWRAHPALNEWMFEWARMGSGKLMMNRVFGTVKFLQFVKPFLLALYDLRQAFWAGSARSVRTPIFFAKALKSMVFHDKHYYDMMDNGGSSRPYFLPWESLEKQARMAMHSDNVLKQAVEYIRQTLPSLGIDAVMRPLLHSAWWGDRLIRMMTYHFFRTCGLDIRSAAQETALVHADYAGTPPTTRRLLNYALFTPTFLLEMAKHHVRVTTSFAKVLANTMRLKRSSRVDVLRAQQVVGILAEWWVTDQIMRMLGFTADRNRYGYRYYKKVVDEQGRERELVITLPSPSNVVLRWVWGFTKLPTTAGKTRAYVSRLSWRLHPIWRIAVNLAMNRTAEGGSIYEMFDDSPGANLRRARAITGYIIKEVLPVLDVSQRWLAGDSRDSRLKAQKALKHDVGRLWYYLLRTSTFQYLRETREKRAAAKVQALQRELMEIMRRDFETVSSEVAKRRVDAVRRRIEDLVEQIEEEKKRERRLRKQRRGAPSAR
ncbi:MAG: hypothetical protein ACXQT3_01845, partial [Methermicoccaceae archaeon]